MESIESLQLSRVLLDCPGTFRLWLRAIGGGRPGQMSQLWTIVHAHLGGPYAHPRFPLITDSSSLIDVARKAHVNVLHWDMEFRNLATTSTTDLVDCLHRSFSDYFVPVRAPVDFWEQRWCRGRVNYALSFGAFDGTELAGFILNGVDDGTAFNLVSGVVPEHRGKRLIKQLYQHAIPLLVQQGVQQCALEVITKNEKAIRAYSSAGFRIAKEYKCYAGPLATRGEAEKGYSFQRAERADWERYKPLRTYSFSWENADAALDRLFEGFACWELLAPGGGLAAYIILNPQTGFIAQLGAARDAYCMYLQVLLGFVARHLAATVKINNVAAEAADTIAVLEGAGLRNYLDQYGMELSLAAPGRPSGQGATQQLSSVR